MGKNKVKILNFILYIWQLPQNLLGMLVKLFTKAESTERVHYWKYTSRGFKVPLTEFLNTLRIIGRPLT